MKRMANEDLLCSAGSSAWCSGNVRKEWMCMHMADSGCCTAGAVTTL